MNFRIFFVGALLALSITGKAQLKANAVSYQVEIDLTQFNPEAAEELEQTKCIYEVDAYYTDQKLRTMVRNIVRPIEVSLRQRLYTISSMDEYNIDHENRFILLKKDQDFQPKATKNKKTILGHECKEYTFKDYRNVLINVWVAEKLPKNICPAGNFSLKGTVLELSASNGIHYLATDFAEGQLDANFFELPAGYQQDVALPPVNAKKSK